MIKLVLRDEYKYMIAKQVKKKKKKKNCLVTATNSVLTAIEIVTDGKVSKAARLMKELVKIFTAEK